MLSYYHPRNQMKPWNWKTTKWIIISHHIIDLHSSSFQNNLIKICTAHHPPPFVTQPASSPHRPRSSESRHRCFWWSRHAPVHPPGCRWSAHLPPPWRWWCQPCRSWGEPLCISRNPSRNLENPKKMEWKVERNQKFGLTCFFWWNCGWFHRFKYTNYTILQRTSCFCINVCVM